MKKPNRDPPNTPEEDDGDLIPRDDPIYAGMGDKAVDAYQSLARSWNRYERSAAWHIRLLRRLGVDWVTMLGFKLRISRVRCRLRWMVFSIDTAIARFLEAVDRWIGGGWG